MPYTIVFTPHAARQFNKLAKDVQRKLQQLIEQELAINPLHPIKSKKLKGHPYYRMASGDYRIIYSIEHDELIVQVLKVGDRKDIYNRIPK